MDRRHADTSLLLLSAAQSEAIAIIVRAGARTSWASHYCYVVVRTKLTQQERNHGTNLTIQVAIEFYYCLFIAICCILYYSYIVASMVTIGMQKEKNDDDRSARPDSSCPRSGTDLQWRRRQLTANIKTSRQDRHSIAYCTAFYCSLLLREL
jgi:hypothetical protein